MKENPREMTQLRLRPDELAWTDVDGEIVALDESTALYLAANESGGLLWRALADGASRDELSDLLARTYGLTAERARQDTDAFLATLRDRGLLHG